MNKKRMVIGVLSVSLITLIIISLVMAATPAELGHGSNQIDFSAGISGVGNIISTGAITAPQFCIGSSCLTTWPTFSLADNSVTSAKILDSTITTSDLASNIDMSGKNFKAASATYSTYINTDSYNMKLHWAGQGGQPTWLWGSNDGADSYVWNPSNFNVNYATTAGNADTLDGYHVTAFMSNGGILGYGAEAGAYAYLDNRGTCDFNQGGNFECITTRNIGQHQFCALSKVLYYNNKGGNSHITLCSVGRSGSDWMLYADASMTDGEMSYAYCEAVCF